MVGKLTILLVVILIYGCDPTFPPFFINEYPGEIEIIDFKKDGNQSSVLIPSCIAVAVGPIESQRGVIGSSRIIIKWQGKIIHDFSEKDLRELLEKQVNYDGDAVWIIDPSGLRLSEERTCSLEKKIE